MEPTDVRAPLAREGPAPDRGERPTRLARLAWPLAAFWLLTWLTAVALVIANRSAIRTFDQADPVDLILPIGFVVIGTLLASRTPRNPIGWIFLGIAVIGALSGVSTQYVFRSTHFAPWPFSAWVAWVHDPLNWLVFPAGLATFFFVLFPDGHLHSRRGRWLMRFAVLVVVVGFGFLVLQTSIELAGSPRIPNPLGSVAVVDMNNGTPGVIWLIGLVVLVTAMVGIIVRTRRSSGELRQQLRWLAFASALTAAALVGLVGSFSVGFNAPGGAFDAVIVLGFGIAVPVSCGIAILKHGLYELDVVISKTVVYAVLAAFFTAVYLAIVVGIGTAIGSTHSSFLTVLAAATIAVAFNPVRDRAKRFANRVVYGKRATPYEVLSEFSDRVAGTYASEDVLPRMAQILATGTGAVVSHVWLRFGNELRAAASWPEDRTVAPVAIKDDRPAEFISGEHGVEVRHQGELLGALSVASPSSDPMNPSKAKLVHDLAAQAGLVLRNVRLIEELRASRRRIVAAQDERAKALERNIHDGAQQQLVSLAIKLGLLERTIGADDERARAMAAELKAEASEALDELRDLARGIYPPLLADKGLGTALEAQVRKAAVSVELTTNGIGRYPPEVEAAVYFCCLEALNNVSKYARARCVGVDLRETSEGVTFEVVDDGDGFDPTTTGYGTGLQGMADRLEAIGGRLEVTSAPGAGTTITGRAVVARKVQ